MTLGRVEGHYRVVSLSSVDTVASARLHVVWRHAVAFECRRQQELLDPWRREATVEEWRNRKWSRMTKHSTPTRRMRTPLRSEDATLVSGVLKWWEPQQISIISALMKIRIFRFVSPHIFASSLMFYRLKSERCMSGFTLSGKNIDNKYSQLIYDSRLFCSNLLFHIRSVDADKYTGTNYSSKSTENIP